MLASDHSAFFSPRASALRSLAALLLAVVAIGCSPHIGDKCSVSTDCSAAGDRLCDITEPGGYCTVFNCEPDSCPDDAACVNFGTRLSSLPGCSVSQGNSPYERSFCLASCESQSDCRSGYDCVEPEVVGGVKADNNRSNKVCAVRPISIDPNASLNMAGVCLGSDAGLPAAAGGQSSVSTGALGQSGAGGDSGAAGQSGAGGESGAAGQSGAGGESGAAGQSGAPNPQ